MADSDNQQSKPGSPPTTPSTTPDIDVPARTQATPPKLGARSAFIQDQWQQGLTGSAIKTLGGTPQAKQPEDIKAEIQRVYSQLQDDTWKRFHAEVDRLDPKADTFVSGAFKAEHGREPTKEEYVSLLAQFGGVKRAQTGAYDAWIAANPEQASRLAPHNKQIQEALRRKADNDGLSARVQEQRRIEREDAEKRRQRWSSQPSQQAASTPVQAKGPFPQAEKAASKPQSTDGKELPSPTGKAQRSPQFIDNVNVGAQQSKFNDFSNRATVLQQRIKSQRAAPTKGATSSPKPDRPIATPPVKTNKAKTALGLGLMGIGGVGGIIATGARKGFAGAEKPQSSPNDSDLAFLKLGWDRWRDLLSMHAELSQKRTLDQFKLWLQEHPGVASRNGALLTTDSWKDHDDYQDYLRKLEEQQRKARETAQPQSQKKFATHASETYYPLHYSSEEVRPEQVEREAPTGGQSAAPSRTPPPENSSRSNQPSLPRRRPRIGATGRSSLSSARSALGAVTKIARVAAFMWPWGVIIISIIILIAVIFRPDDPSDGTHSGEISVTTQDTKVENPEDEPAARGASNAIVASVQTQDKKAVLAVSAEDLQDLIDRTKERADEYEERIKDFMDRYIKSLITYTITARYDGPAYEITARYPIPENAIFVKASGVYEEEIVTDDKGKKRTVAVKWQFTKNGGGPSGTSSAAPTNAQTGINFTKYTQAPYFLPQPQPGGDSFNDSTITALNRLGNAISQNSSYLQSKFPAKYVDPFLSVIWVGAIEGIGDRPYFWNCQDRIYDINAGCPGGYYSGGWQVGYGIQVAQVGGHLAADFDSIYGTGSSGNAAKVKEVGQAVISGSGGKITNPSVFPSETIPSLVSRANSGNQAAQQAIAILLFDQKLGATTIALEVAGDIRAQDNWAGTMRGWGSYYGTNMQSFSNRAKAIADKYSGQGGGDGGTGSGGVFGPKSFTVTVVPRTPDSSVESTKATMIVDEVEGTAGSTTATSSGMPSNNVGDGRHVAPSTDSCGKYSLSSNPAGKNYGDPTCNYDKNKLYEMLKSLDPQNADRWFNVVIPCESAYDPNTFYRSGAAGDTPDPYGAWGLFQMGRGVNGPFTDLTKGSANNPSVPEDRGDVNWEMQVSNAVNFNRKYLSSQGRPMGEYWECARR